ncbi:hypothetical protein KZR06_15895 (plasmid) [Lacticaseibacillus paracasei]|uniref:hypothetical protein n=1 Tax=Lacticaseibacillus paracasei TaxID=1597 RepID=UPI0021A2672E|nr:hypothetical protein [Lacticaseibacillus paracasei]UWP78291.1 hypothetical protein KZR06_15895 [Lacticaseibacillus paracasei]
MEATKEELKAAFKDLLSDNDFRREIRSEISPVGGLNPVAKTFKAEVKDELRKRYEQRFGTEAYGSYKLVEAFNTLLRYHFDLRNVSSLSDDQVPQARELFNGYTQLLDLRRFQNE